ncbi:MAG TPA: tellurite resistance TerB family protein [Geminicoccaceae bacterium]|nr:tellurite resistance TerB family protein [Geminicoccus sp.]HMU51217.1 tellurite resistance TerB family protein [Geminicoccaceae bacterium]
MFNAQEVLGQLMGAGMSPSSGRRIDNALGGQGGGGGGILEQILGGLQQGGGSRGTAGGGALGGLGDLLRPQGGGSVQGGGSMPGGSTRVSGGTPGGAGGMGSLGDLLGGLGGALGGGGSGGQPGRSGQGNPLAAGGLGALAGVLLGRGKSSMGNAIGGAGIAILGSLAMQALRKMGEQKAVEAQAGEMQAQGRLPGQGMASSRQAPPAVPAERIETDEDVPLGVRPPRTAGEEAVLASKAMILLQAMISAAKADGQIDGGEMQRIVGKMEEGGADGEARDFVLQEMRKPLDLDALVAQVQTPELAAEVYAASLLAIEVDTPAEQAYLQQLAQKLRLHPMVVDHLHQQLGVSPGT